MRQIPYNLINRACSEIAMTDLIFSFIKNPNDGKIKTLVKIIGAYPIATHILNNFFTTKEFNRKYNAELKDLFDDIYYFLGIDIDIRKYTEKKEDEKYNTLVEAKIDIAKRMKKCHLKESTIAKVLKWKPEMVERILMEEEDG